MRQPLLPRPAIGDIVDREALAAIHFGQAGSRENDRSLLGGGATLTRQCPHPNPLPQAEVGIGGAWSPFSRVREGSY
jgi:hypothetical protein